MSPASADRLDHTGLPREIRTPARHVCRGCASRRARFRYRGEIRADRDHTLCFRCFRAEVNRARARRLYDVTTPAPLKAAMGEADPLRA